MKAPRAGRPNQHRRTMELLAQARPARLDPAPEHTRRATALAIVDQAVRDSGEARPASPATPPDRPRRSGRAVLRHRAALGAGATLTAAAATVALLVASGGLAPGTRSHLPAADRAHSLSAQQILLTAAVSAAKQPSQGRYWRVSDVSAGAEAAGPNAHPYAISQLWAPEVTWDARSPKQRSWNFPSAGYTESPATKGAAAAWRADGSPRLPAQHSAQQAWWQYGATGYFGNANLTLAQIQRLPASPGGLAAAVQKAAEQQMAPVPHTAVRLWSAVDQTTLSQNMFGVYAQLLKWDPITPAVRAAVYEDLARVPGVHSIGKVTDPLGRPGYGIAQGGGPGNTDEVLVIAPGTGLLLADEFITVKSTPLVPLAPSGAVPGLARCPKGTTVTRHAAIQHAGLPVCKLSLAQAGQLLPASEYRPSVAGHGSGKGFLMVTVGPTMQLAPGQLQSYDAIVSAGWTNASPLLPPPAQRFSVAKDSKG